MAVTIRSPDSIYQASGSIQDGTFHGRWHFSFGEYFDPKYMGFGTMRVFNDDTLSPGAVWPLHPHRDIEVVTYCAEGEFRHADEHGKGGILRKGWVQHTTVGRGLWHSEINNLPDRPMRFIQMWFRPREPGLEPSVEQKKVQREERTDRLLPLVSNAHPDALRIASDAQVFSSFLRKGKRTELPLEDGWAGYVYVLEGGPVRINTATIEALGAAEVAGEEKIDLEAGGDAEILAVTAHL